jgi:hypothetical protein
LFFLNFQKNNVTSNNCIIILYTSTYKYVYFDCYTISNIEFQLTEILFNFSNNNSSEFNKININIMLISYKNWCN